MNKVGEAADTGAIERRDEKEGELASLNERVRRRTVEQDVKQGDEQDQPDCENDHAPRG